MVNVAFSQKRDRIARFLAKTRTRLTEEREKLEADNKLFMKANEAKTRDIEL